MFENSSAKCYQKNKKRLEKGIETFQKKLVKDTKIFLPEKRETKRDNMVANNIKISQKIKNKC